MLSSFFPAERLESYRTSPYKDRIDLIGRRLVEQRYHPEVTAQHLREWLRVTEYLEEQGLRLPLALDAPAVAQYVADRVKRPQCQSHALRVGGRADLPGRRRAGTLSSPHRSGAAAGAVVVEVGSG